jgi:hypothetical protein
MKPTSDELRRSAAETRTAAGQAQSTAEADVLIHLADVRETAAAELEAGG